MLFTKIERHCALINSDEANFDLIRSLPMSILTQILKLLECLIFISVGR